VLIPFIGVIRVLAVFDFRARGRLAKKGK